MSVPWKAYASLTAAMAIVGSSVAVGKAVALSLPLYLALGLRFALACCLALPLLRIREGSLPRLRLRHWVLLFVQTGCGVFLFNTALLHGLRLTDAASAGILTGTTPAWMGLAALLFFHERPGLRGLCGLALACAGALCVSALAGPGQGSLAGNALVLLAVLGEAAFLLLRKALPPGLTALAASTAVSCLGLLQFLPLALWQGAQFDLAALTWGQWLLLAYYGGGVTVLAYVLWFYGVARVPAATAGAFSGLLPVSALFFSWAFLDEPLSLRHLLGCGCVLAAIVLLSVRTGPDRPAAPAIPAGPGPRPGAEG
jgi:drug/metabolite transporter (DMT)-like permease